LQTICYSKNDENTQALQLLVDSPVDLVLKAAICKPQDAALTSDVRRNKAYTHGMSYMPNLGYPFEISTRLELRVVSPMGLMMDPTNAQCAVRNKTKLKGDATTETLWLSANRVFSKCPVCHRC
jgi:hypothetical protein